MDIDVIRSYLVSLGFQVDNPSLSKFQDALRKVTQSVEAATTGTFGIASQFVKAGAVVTSALASIAAGTVGLIDHVAQSDLGFQVLGRRMFTTTAQARSLKTATDALGFSLEEIFWGPKELQERFQMLTNDQKQMALGLGGDFEKQMRNIRDIRFEFTRLEVEVKYFTMDLVKSLSILLGGDENSLLRKLQEFNAWFRENMPAIAQQVAQYIAPVLKDVGAIFHDIWDIAKLVSGEILKFVGILYGDGNLQKGVVTIESIGTALDHVAHTLKTIFDYLDRIAHFVQDNEGKIEKLFPPGFFGEKGKPLSLWGDGFTFGKHGPSIFDAIGSSKAGIQNLIRSFATKMGLDPAIALAIADKETGFNQAARGKAGEVGVMQLMPNTAMSLGVDPYDLNQNIQGGIRYLLQLYQQYHDWSKAIAAYNGKGPAARSYADDVIHNRIPKWEHSMDYGGKYQTGATIGSITVNVTHPNATPDQIAAAVKKGVADAAFNERQRVIVQNGGVYA